MPRQDQGAGKDGVQRAAQIPAPPAAKAPAARDASPGAATATAPSGKQTAQAQNGGQAPEAPKPQAPGQVTATEEEAERALERSLVSTGVLLLPFGQVEVQPNASYVRRENQAPVISSINGDLVLSQQKVRRNEFQQSLSSRGGLPFDTQLEFNLPYNEVDQENVNNVAVATSSRSGTGWGTRRPVPRCRQDSAPREELVARPHYALHLDRADRTIQEQRCGAWQWL